MEFLVFWEPQKPGPFFYEMFQGAEDWKQHRDLGRRPIPPLRDNTNKASFTRSISADGEERLRVRRLAGCDASARLAYCIGHQMIHDPFASTLAYDTPFLNGVSASNELALTSAVGSTMADYAVAILC